ncbi:MAG: hypothetical protein H7X99_07025 [Saprospiraceae bacterium]|nr:hypothetical protein [Saprospiraceae bacterium]
MSKNFLLLLPVIILTFISCGKDDSSNVCDGISPTYTNDVAPIFNGTCTSVGCHSGEFPADGMDLSNYVNAKSASLNLNVLKAIKHESGVVAMPQSLPKLSDDKIKVIECWIENGAPE